MLKADELSEVTTQINGEWVVAKPMKQPFILRLKDALKVLKGDAEAVVFRHQ